MNSLANTLATRMVPRRLHTLVATIVPHYWHEHWHKRTDMHPTKRVIDTNNNQHRVLHLTRKAARNEPLGVLQWMMSGAVGIHARTDKLAHQLLLAGEASVMTTRLVVSHRLFGLCANPQYLEHIQEETIYVW